MTTYPTSLLKRTAFGALKGALVLSVAFGLGLFAFAAGLPDVVPDSTTNTDVIVVLTGGSNRFSTGIDLLNAGRAPVLFLSGVGPQVTLEDLEDVTEDLDTALPKDLRGRIILGYDALNTYGNAQETAAWMTACGYNSVRLVTASYHMPRAIAEFKAVMPDVILIPHPVFSENIKQAQWWRWSGTARLMAREYAKFLVAWMRGQLGLVPTPAPFPPSPAGAACP